MVVTVISSNKITLNMFIDFYRYLYAQGKNIEFVPINILFSEEKKKSIIDSIGCDKYKDSVVFVPIKVPAKTREIKDTYESVLPSSLYNISDMVVAFECNSTTPIQIKGDTDTLTGIFGRWEQNITKLSQQ
jgi:hypothetical protein